MIGRLLAWFVRRWNKLEGKAQIRHAPAAPHVHRWRKITEYARQCDIRECAMLEMGPDMPDYMRSYLELMTTTRARKDPIGEAQIYSSFDPRTSLVDGISCSGCARIIPLETRFCPYCNRAQPIT